MEDHIRHCLQVQCFCKQVFFFDSKQNKSFDFTLRYKSNKSVFGKALINHFYFEYVKCHPKDPSAAIHYSEFIFHKYKNVHLASVHLMNNSNNNLTLY